jgi:hypothetical protein
MQEPRVYGRPKFGGSGEKPDAHKRSRLAFDGKTVVSVTAMERFKLGRETVHPTIMITYSYPSTGGCYHSQL